MNPFIFITAFLLSYLIGSICTAVWVSRYFYGVDIRDFGSRNAGATNVLRILGKKPALFVFVVDALKGFLPVHFLPFFFDLTPYTNHYIIVQIGLGFAVVLGHIFPVFEKFRGGKGVATLMGICFGIVPLTTFFCLIFFLLVLKITKIVSLSSMTTALFFCFYIFFIEQTQLIALELFALMSTCLLILTHRQNIQRILRNQENKIKF